MPDGLWDAHTHLTYWGEDALDSLAAYGVVGVRDCGGDPVLLKKWRDEIARGERRGPKIYFSGPHINGPRPDSANRLIVRTPDDARRAVDSLAALHVDFVKTHTVIPPAAYYEILRAARAHHLKVASHLPSGVPAWSAADSGAASIEHIVESILVSPMSAGYVKTLDEAMDWWASPAGDTMIVHMARTGFALDPTISAYQGFIAMGRDSAERAGRQAVYDFTLKLTNRFYRAGVTILAGSDFADRDYDQRPGSSIIKEIKALEAAGLTPEDARRAAGENVRKWLER
jgi:sugar phosphate isomerase/epimerase